MVSHQRRFGDLISYQNSGKGCTAIVDKVERIVSEYTGQRIYMRANEVLISADPDVRVPRQISRPVANQSGPFAHPCQRSSPKPPQQARPRQTLHTQHQHEHAVKAPLRVRGDRARLTGEEPSRNRSQPALDGSRHLDRLPLTQARAGTGHHSGPTYLARDSSSPTAKSTPIQITQFGTTQGGRPGD